MALAFFATSVARNVVDLPAGGARRGRFAALTAGNGRSAVHVHRRGRSHGHRRTRSRSAPGGRLDGEQIARAFQIVMRSGCTSRAFSRHYVSGRSIPDTLNFDFDDDSWGPELRHADDGKVGSPLFDRLSQQGMEVVSYDTPHIDFCFPVASRCEVLPSFNPFSPYITNSRFRRVGAVSDRAARLCRELRDVHVHGPPQCRVREHVAAGVFGVRRVRVSALVRSLRGATSCRRREAGRTSRTS